MKSGSRKEYTISVETILTLFALLYCIKCSFDFPVDPDTFTLIRTGKEIWLTKSCADPFSWPPPSCKVPWINHEWLAYVTLSIFHEIGGFSAVIIYKTFLYVLSFFILLPYASRKYGSIAAIVAVIVAIYLGRWFLSPRAMVYSAIFFPLLTYLLLRLQDDEFTYRYFILFPLTFLGWVCFHGGSNIGIIFLALAFVILALQKTTKTREREKKIRIVLKFMGLWIICLLVILFCTPFGLENFKFFLNFFVLKPVCMRVSSEMESPFLRPEFNIHYIVITSVTLILLGFYSFKQKIKPSLIELYAFSFWLLASLRAVRNMQLFSTACIPIFAFIISHTYVVLREQKLFMVISDFFLRRRFILDLLKIIALFLMLAVFFFHLSVADLTAKSAEKILFAPGLRDFLLNNELPPNLYCHDVLGSWFIYYLYPKYKVSFDCRWNMVYSDDYFIEIENSFYERNAFFHFINKYDVDTVIVHYKYHPCFVENDRGWFLIYEGEGCRVYLRNVKRNEKIIEKFKEDKLYYPEIYDVNAFLYRSHLDLNNYEIAKKYLMKLIVEAPGEKILRDHLKTLDRMIQEKKNG